MSGGHMSIEMRMEKTLKSNSKKEVTALDVIVNDAATGALPYMSRSGGERVKAALSVILALAELKSSTAGVQLGFLFIDEPPFLDDKGVQAYCDALEAIQKRYSDVYKRQRSILCTVPFRGHPQCANRPFCTP